MCEHGIAADFFQDGRFGLGIDTLNLARKAIRDNESGIGIPSAYNLPTLFQFVTGMLPSMSHRAMADVKATSTIFRFQIFFETKRECLFNFSETEEAVRVNEARLPVNDSESEGSGDSQCDDESSVSSSPSTTEEIEDNEDIPLGDTWDQGIEFQPIEPNPNQLFVEYYTSTARTRSKRVGA